MLGLAVPAAAAAIIARYGPRKRCRLAIAVKDWPAASPLNLGRGLYPSPRRPFLFEIERLGVHRQ